MHKESKGDERVTYDNELADPEAVVRVSEWVLTSLAIHISHDNVDLHAVFRRDLTSLTPEIAH